MILRILLTCVIVSSTATGCNMIKFSAEENPYLQERGIPCDNPDTKNNRTKRACDIY